jgi:hypothetical protein
MALHVEREHGTNGPRYIAAQIERNAAAGEAGGLDLWRKVARRFDQLSGTDVGASEGARERLL